MIIFIKHIPHDTLLLELYNFVAPVLKSVVMECDTEIIKVEITKIKFLRLRNPATKASEYHGLVYVDSDAGGKAAIKKLDGMNFRNKPIVVTEFSIESDGHDTIITESENNTLKQSQ